MPHLTSQTPARRARETEPGSLRDDRITQAYEKLRELIVWGRLAPGTRIIESDVAERLGISRTPVRSALQRLQQEGYITAPDGARQARLAVAPLTQEDAHELFSIVGQVEGLAARRAAELPLAARRTLTETLRRINGELLRVAELEVPDTNLIFTLDFNYHQSYVDAGAGPRLLALHRAVKPQAERYNRLYTTALVGEIQTSYEEHEEIHQAIAAGDPDRADRAAETNFVNAARRLSKVIASLGERGSW